MTAEEFLEIKEPNTIIVPKEWLIEFAKYHVEQALKASHSNFQLPEEEIEFTLNAYPLENIK